MRLKCVECTGYTMFRLKTIGLLKNFELALFVSHSGIENRRNTKMCGIYLSDELLKVSNPSRTFTFDWI